MDVSEIGKKIVTDLIGNEKVQEKVLNVTDMLFPYAGIEKRAVDIYVKEIENSNLSTESKIIALLNVKKEFKKLKNQGTIANIARENARVGTDFSEESKMDQEWLDRFMESAAFVSSPEMQLVWGKILANEFEVPGSTPLNMTRILSEFTHRYAEAFRKLCSMRALLVIMKDGSCQAEWKYIIPFKENDEFMRPLGISFNLLAELETLGVIKFDTIAGFVSRGIEDQHLLLYVDGRTIETTSHSGRDFPIGNVIFTEAGHRLSQITESTHLEGYFEAVKKYLKCSNVVLEEMSKYEITIDEDKYRVVDNSRE